MHVHDAYDTIVVFRVHTHGKCRLHHKLEFCQKGWVDLAGFLVRDRPGLPSTYPTVCYTEVQVSIKIRILSV